MPSSPVASPEASSKSEVQEFYNGLNRSLGSTRVGHATLFLNYGYVSLGAGDEASDVPCRVLDPRSVRLAYELIGATDLRGRSVLDVGCGRGGLARLMAEQFGARVTGVDFAADAMSFCRRSHGQRPDVCFVAADAEQLPLADDRFDAVTNLESSHCYASLEAFFAEVRRVLRNDGVFLYADLLPLRRWAEVRTLLFDRLGFQLTADRCITANVVASLQAVSASRLRVFAGADARMKNVLAVPGSTVYERMVSGALEYRMLRCSKRCAE
jgi:phthiocerol/phenolphthiocerol synthesis type-I polyketide synthase E